MAHGDYICCAVCDRKMNYDGMTDDHKEAICSECLKALHAEKIMVYDTNEFVEWIGRQEKKALAKMLLKIGFEECWYANRVEDAIAKVLGEKPANKFKNSGEWLTAIGAL